MKRYFLFLFLCFSFSQIASGYDLVDAVVDKKLTAVFTSTGEHRGKCVNLVVESKVKSTLILEVNAGTYLINTDSNAQDYLITDFQILIIPPGGKQEILLNALCSTRFKNCPKKNGLFEIGYARSDASFNLCKLLQKTQQFEYTGQVAMWSLIEKTDPNEIDGSDSAATMKLRNFVGNALGMKVEPFNKKTYSKPAIVVSESLEIKTSGNHYVRQVQKNDRVEYAVYDKNDEAVSEVKTNVVIANKQNKHNVIWDFSLENLNPKETYYFKIKVNGVTQKEWAYYFWG